MRKTLEDIIPPSRRRTSSTRQQDVSDNDLRFNSENKHSSKRRFSYTPAVVAGVVIVIAGIALFMFSNTRIQIDPMTATANLSGTFTASASTTTPLPFAVISVKKVATKTVSGNSTKTVHKASSGTITVYNTRSVRQKLVAKTRFESPNGLVFRIRDAITVPSAHGIIPGSVTTRVYADEAGSRYNISPTSFTLPGLSGTSLASKVYAKSGSAMSGGFSGTEAQVSPDTEASARGALHTALAKDMANAIQAQVPKGYILLKGASATIYKNLLNIQASTAGKASVRVQGVTTAVVFPKSDFAKLIATSIIGTYSGQPVKLTSTSGITLIPAKSIPSSKDVANNEAFDFALSGNTTVVWDVNPERIATAVAGKTRDEAQTVLRGFPEIKQAHLSMSPFWENTLPNDPSKITVTVNQVKTVHND